MRAFLFWFAILGPKTRLLFVGLLAVLLFAVTRAWSVPVSGESNFRIADHTATVL